MKREINTRSINNTIKGRVPNLRGLAAIIVTVLSFGAVIFGQSEAGMGSMDPASLSGTVTLEIPSASGNVRVILPDDIRAGDTISGTVVFSGKGVLEGEVLTVKTVEGEVVAVKSSDPGNRMFKFIVPAGLASIPFMLNSASGKHIGTAVLNVNSDLTGTIPTQLNPVTKPGTITYADHNFAPPRLGQTGRNISIPGNFDGSAGNTSVNIGGTRLPVIAESPRKSVVRIPADLGVGPRQLTISEGNGKPQTSTFNVASVELKADKLNLMRGEKTTLHVSVTGLEGLPNNSEVQLRLENATPQVTRLSFSREFQSLGTGGTLMTRPVKADGTGSITYTETLTGVSPGAFTINAFLFAPPPRKDKGKKKEKEETIDPDSLRGRLKNIAKLKREAANAAVGNSDVKHDLEDNAKNLEGKVGDKKLWNDKGGTKYIDNFIKMLKEEKVLLGEKQTQVGKGTAADKIGDAITEIDKAIEAAEAERDKDKK